MFDVAPSILRDVARLVVRTGEGTERAVSLDADRLTIGRTEDNDLTLDDGLVSRRHAELVRSQDGFTFVDLGSHNGSKVNGQTSREHRLQHGDQIRVGRSSLRFEDPQAALPRPTEEHRLQVDRSIDETWSHVHAQPVSGEGGEGAALQQALGRLELLDRVGRRVLSVATLDEVMEIALKLVLDAIRAERGAIELWNPQSGELARRLEKQRDEVAPEPGVRIPSSIVDEVTSERVAIVTSDARHDERFAAGATVAAAQIRSALCAPLWEEDQIHGVLYLDSREGAYRFTRDDLVLATAIANLVAARVKQEQLREELAEQQLVRANLERYHAPEVVKAILSRPDGPGGVEECEVTILFADIVGFTSLAEASTPAEVARLLDEYYELATQAVFEQGGTVNEYIGDSMMAIFGAPIAQDDHADRAVTAGLDIFDRIRARNAASGDDLQLHVAANSGKVVVGSVGPPQRMKYAVVGDTVNVAARIEDMGNPGTLLIGEATQRGLRGDWACESLGAQQFKGRSRPVEVYAVAKRR